MLAGGIAAFALTLQPAQTRSILVQYSAVRAAQCIYESLRKSYPTINKHNDTIWAAAFALCSGQLVYNFIMHPETLDPAYENFLTRVTRVHPAIIQSFRMRFKYNHMDWRALDQYLARAYPDGLPSSQIDVMLRKTPTVIGCELCHAHEPACLSRIINIWPYVFRLMFPVYASLHTIPPIIFGLKRVLKNPSNFIRACLKNSVRSSSFMATFIIIFQSLLCAYRKLHREGLVHGDHPYNYWIFAFIASVSVFVEKPSRRAELALYVHLRYLTLH